MGSERKSKGAVRRTVDRVENLIFVLRQLLQAVERLSGPVHRDSFPVRSKHSCTLHPLAQRCALWRGCSIP